MGGLAGKYNCFGFRDSFIILSPFQEDDMSGLKNSWEIGLEKSDEMLPDIKKRKKLTQRQKEKIGEIRQEYKAKIADKEVMLQHKLDRLTDRIPPDELAPAVEELKKEFAEDRAQFEKEMESHIEAVHEQSGK